MNFKGKNAYITGGTSGIGLGFARIVAKQGGSCFLMSVDKQSVVDDALEELKKLAISPKQEFVAVNLDVTDHEQVDKVLTEAVNDFGPAYFLVNSAGIGGAIYFEQLTYERFDRTMKINVYGTRNTVHALLPSLKQTQGQILNVSSFSGLVGIVGYTAYSTSKFAVVGFSQALRSEVRQYGISVSVLCPTQVETPLLQQTDKFKPPETKTINNNAGALMTADEVAKATMLEMDKGKFIIVPGVKPKIFHVFNRFFPELREAITDRVIRKVQKQGAAKPAEAPPER